MMSLLVRKVDKKKESRDDGMSEEKLERMS